MAEDKAIPLKEAMKSIVGIRNSGISPQHGRYEADNDSRKKINAGKRMAFKRHTTLVP